MLPTPPFIPDQGRVYRSVFYATRDSIRYLEPAVPWAGVVALSCVHVYCYQSRVHLKDITQVRGDGSSA